MNNGFSFNLGHGFNLELVKTIPNDKGCELEGFLTFNGAPVMLDKKDEGVLYPDKTSVINDFNTRIIPKYVSKLDVKAIKFLDTEEQIKVFVTEYLREHKKDITYGTTIDVIKILKTKGYVLPDEEDSAQVYNLMQFFRCVDKLSYEFKRQLVMFGFPADRNTKDSVDHQKGDRHLRCKNIVYTRFPWITGYKTISLVNNFIKATECDLSDGLDTKTLKKKSPELYDILINLTSTLSTINDSTKAGMEYSNFSGMTSVFKTYIRNNKFELIKKWSRRRPKNYGVYKD